MSVMMATTTVNISDCINYNTILSVVLTKYCSNAILSIIKACLQVPVELKNPTLQIVCIQFWVELIVV
jgi:hypothetical protein